MLDYQAKEKNRLFSYTDDNFFNNTFLKIVEFSGKEKRSPLRHKSHVAKASDISIT